MAIELSSYGDVSLEGTGVSGPGWLQDPGHRHLSEKTPVPHNGEHRWRHPIRPGKQCHHHLFLSWFEFQDASGAIEFSVANRRDGVSHQLFQQLPLGPDHMQLHSLPLLVSRLTLMTSGPLETEENSKTPPGSSFSMITTSLLPENKSLRLFRLIVRHDVDGDHGRHLTGGKPHRARRRPQVVRHRGAVAGVSADGPVGGHGAIAASISYNNESFESGGK
ncbi:hypothetical protein EYF80_039549 [Liparis tanakae]|uniref:Uncharacterized protein n=1 Tax=Liparis tanakae TaxID=230148 RepID=A0A4Z2GC30_9TELE|nr:hypothetical protein EYF80_039549 [Liparis tanakae]